VKFLQLFPTVASTMVTLSTVSAATLGATLINPAPADAAGLRSWWFNESTNQLNLATTHKVQPKVQLITNPTRLVVDLPGVILNRPVVNQSIGDKIRSLRVGQFDRQTTRIVIELASGYTLNPQEIGVYSTSGTQWSIQLPQPQPISLGKLSPANPDVTLIPVGHKPDFSTQPLLGIPDRSTRLAAATILANKSNTPNGFSSNSGGTQSSKIPGFSAEIQSVRLDPASGQLLIQSDLPIQFTTGWERSTRMYRVAIPSAVIAANFEGPELFSDGPFSKVRLRQEDEQTVAILLDPALGTQIIGVNQLNSRQLVVQTRPSNRPAANWSEISTLNQSSLKPNPTNSTLVQPSLITNRLNKGRLVVVLDPGHGGTDPGAIGIGGLREVDVVMPISMEVARILEKQGIQVVMTRKSNIDLGLGSRVEIAQRVGATVFVSIHANAISVTRPEVNGLETFYTTTQSEPLARSIQASMLQATGMRSRGVKKARFYVTRHTTMPSVLVETGFVTGSEDAPRLADPQFRSLLAQAIARGILNYLQ
jgi:N-acetylmuramoyl-L-alanine amidase